MFSLLIVEVKKMFGKKEGEKPIRKTLFVREKPEIVLKEMENCSKSIADYKTERTEENSLKIHDNLESLLNVLSDDDLEVLFFNNVDDSLLFRSNYRERIINLKEFHETVKSLTELSNDPKIKELLSGKFLSDMDDVVFKGHVNFYYKFREFRENIKSQVNGPIKILEEIDDEFIDLRQAFRVNRMNYKKDNNQTLNQEQNSSSWQKIGAFFAKIFSFSFFKGNDKADVPIQFNNEINFANATNMTKIEQDEIARDRSKKIDKAKTNEINI